jgi:hypothetical protein
MIDGVTIFVAGIAVPSILATILIALKSRKKLPASRDRILWWLPLIVVVAAAAVLLGLMIHSADAPILYVFLIAPLVCFVFILWLLAAAIRRKPRRCLSVVLALVGFLAISWALDRNEGTIRPFLRWMLWSHRFKAELMSQPEPANGELKHFLWDEWGFVPSGFNSVYLVFDPADSLANAAKSKAPGQYGGIPCGVLRVFRLEKQWYAVSFYTDEDWKDCPSTERRTPQTKFHPV